MQQTNEEKQKEKHMHTPSTVQKTESEPRSSRVFQYTKRVTLLAVAVTISLVGLPRLTRSDGGNADLTHESHGLEGSWSLSVSPILPPGAPPVTVKTYLTFCEGGASISSDRTRPFASPQHGTWMHVQGHEFAGTFVQDLFDQAGTFVGTFKGRTRILLVARNEFVGVANVEQRDASGNFQYSRCARFVGERIVVEPLAAPCEDLEPGI
jgi:hypothetical protein